MVHLATRDEVALLLRDRHLVEHDAGELPLPIAKGPGILTIGEVIGRIVKFHPALTGAPLVARDGADIQLEFLVRIRWVRTLYFQELSQSNPLIQLILSVEVILMVDGVMEQVLYVDEFDRLIAVRPRQNSLWREFLLIFHLETHSRTYV